MKSAPQILPPHSSSINGVRPYKTPWLMIHDLPTFLRSVPASLSNVVAIAAGGDHSLALKSDGTIVAWGSNDHGESTIPAGLGPGIAISAGFADSMALVLPSSPSMQAHLSGGVLALSWPINYIGFTPQWSPRHLVRPAHRAGPVERPILGHQ